ncbi:hypothetical protein B7P43_G16266 [Cryptotermes secundus]|uniref:Major facilitator superfamily (MFS) profile domain-containing protein n=1 Tax=Cryptotermes secundus TaxID=105785 RepID=A0A2J7QE67_9NEOP|nr:hypothetical protein B7P43_G16266 [Cryptotermes secundus]
MEKMPMKLEEAAPMLNGDTAVVKQKVLTPQTPTNKNGFVSVDDLQPGSKRTLQGLLPQLLVSGAAFLLAAGAGMPIGYSAVLLPQLQVVNSTLPTDDEIGSWITSVHSAATPVGSFVSGLMMDKWGRRRVLQLCVVPLTLGWVMIAVAQSHVVILTGRIMAGLAVGLSAAPGQAKLELQQLVSRVHSEKESSSGNISSWRMFFKPQVLKPVAIVNVFHLVQIVSGTYLVIFYAVNLISETENEAGGIDKFLVAVLTAVFRLIFITIACFLLLWVGRRPLALFSGVGSSVAALGVGTFLYYRQPSSESLNTWIVAGFILTYVATNTVGFFVLPGIAIGELLPVKIRGAFGGYIFAIFNVLLFFMAKVFPAMLHTMGSHGVFWMFGMSSLLGTLFVYLFFPETKGKSLEEIEDYFAEKNVMWLTRKKHQNADEPLKA